MKKLSLIILLAACFTSAFSQKGGALIFTVGQDSVWAAEFERVYSKNNKVEQKKPTQQELEEYQDLYIKFKLKVKEAYRLQMDTNKDYIKELAGYRKQLAQPYLTDQQVTETLMKEAYSRLENEVRASNLMVHVSYSAPPADTLAALRRIQNWQKLIASGAYDFNQLAQDSSTDRSAKTNRGDLGYFAAFDMIYEFENPAYKTKVGGVSEIFRTQYGYHLLKVNDKRPSRGEVKVAHILIRVNNEEEYDIKKERIDAIYKLLQEGGDWNELVQQHTEDFGSRKREGELNWLKSVGGGIPAEFKEAAFALENDGDYSAPIKTEMGWHIVKRVEHRPLKSYDQLKQWLKFKINKDQRGKLNKDAMLGKLKTTNNFTEIKGKLDWVTSQVDSNIMRSSWTIPESLKTEDVLFTIAEKPYSVHDFCKFMMELQTQFVATSIENFTGSAYIRYVEQSNFAYEESVLEEKYPEFKYLMQEYRDGILLFELTNNMVWNKATEDTIGLEKFFQSNQSNYMWEERLVGKKYICSDPAAFKKLKKYVSKGKDDAFITSKLNAKNPLAVKIETVLVEKGKNEEYDKVSWTPGVVEMASDSKNKVLLKVDSVMERTPKEMKETLGIVISDYQDFLEDEWIESLKKRYPVKVNEGALNTLFQ